jgi:hypothetical protein
MSLRGAFVRAEAVSDTALDIASAGKHRFAMTKLSSYKGEMNAKQLFYYPIPDNAVPADSPYIRGNWL